jgi:uncharacterized protein with HEPN domain
MQPDPTAPGRRWRARVGDMLEAMRRIDRYTRDLTLETFAANEMVIDAVVRNFAVLGEAAGHVGPEIMARYPAVPWAVMRRMRNIVIHQYFGVSVPILWQTARADLPPLVPVFEQMLMDAEPAEPEDESEDERP